MRRRISSAAESTTATPARSSAPRPVFGSALFINRPATTGLAPKQTGTVSMCAISSRRGPGIVPGSFTIKLPTFPLRGVRLWALSNTIASGGQPASRSQRQIRSATSFSCPETPGMLSKSSTTRRAAARSGTGGTRSWALAVAAVVQALSFWGAVFFRALAARLVVD